MRSTVRIDDDLFEELRSRAAASSTSVTRVLNDVVRAGLLAGRRKAPKRPTYREATFSMGAPRLDLRKALAVASALEDEELVRKSMLRK
jgi:hypothetical protein